MKLTKSQASIKLIIVCLLLFASSSVAWAAGAAESRNEDSMGQWPQENEIQIIVPFPAGGTADVVVRRIAQLAEPEFDEPIVVINRPGAGGAVAAAEYMAEAPNTNKLIYVIDSVLTATPLLQDVPFTRDDFAPVIGVEEVNFILYVNPGESGIDSVDSLVEFAQENRVLYSVGGPLAPNALIQRELFNQMGADAEMVVFNGAIEGVNSLAAGDVHVTAVTPAHGKNFVARGDLLPLMAFNENGYDEFPDISIPPAADFGYDIDFTALLYLTIRSGTDPEVIESIYERLRRVYNTPAYQEFMSSNMLSISDMSPAEIEDYLSRKTEAVRDLLPEQ